VPVVAFAGAIEPGFESLYTRGLLAVHPIVARACPLAEALAEGEANLERAVASAVRQMGSASFAL
jgi:glycerate kinase